MSSDHERVPARLPAFLIPGPASFINEAERDRFEKHNLLLAKIWFWSFGSMLVATVITAVIVNIKS